MTVANIVRTSLGPTGLDKMLVDEIGDVTITNDGATILSQLEVEHPAAKVLVELAQLQDKEVGDGTTTVVMIAAELLKRGNELVKKKIHPTTVISGYRLAMKESVKYISEHLSHSTDSIGRESVLNVARTSISSKVIGGELDFFANLAVDAMNEVKLVDAASGDVKCSVKSVNVLKQHGKSARESTLVKGYALKLSKAAQGMPSSVVTAKIALLDFDLQKAKTKFGVQVLISDPKELEAIRKREEDITKERIEKVLAAGANVVLSSRGIDDLNLKYFIEKGVLAVRRVKKDDLRRIAKLTGGSVMTTLADMEGKESFDPSHLGVAAEVSQEVFSDDEMIIIRLLPGKPMKAVSVILRGANDFLLDEMERSVHDALCAVKRCLESKEVVAGGGCVEAALSVHLEDVAMTLESKEQLAVAEFAAALLVIPKQLAVNSAKDATDLVAKLRAHHTLAVREPKKYLMTMGLDLSAGDVKDNLARGVLEPAMSKVKSIQFATEAAISILRIDDFVKLNPKQRADPRGRGAPPMM